MYKAERIRRTKRVINKRKRKLREKYHTRVIRFGGVDYSHIFNKPEPYELEDGYYENNNIMNKYGQYGTALKTKTKHGHATYRHKCAYGPAKRYSKHDQTQLGQTNLNEEF